MRSILILSLWLLVAGHSTVARGASEAYFIKGAESQRHQIPEYLFHWSSTQKLEELVKTNPHPGEVPLKQISPKFGVALQWPQLQMTRLRGMFTWSHPVGAMRDAGFGVNYAGNDPSAARLLVLQPEKNAKILVLKSIFKEPTVVSSGLHPEKADFIFHQVFEKTGELRYQEWIVMNPKKIKRFTADPRAFPASVKAELLTALQNSYELSAKDRHAPANQMSDYERQSIRALLGTEGFQVPGATKIEDSAQCLKAELRVLLSSQGF